MVCYGVARSVAMAVALVISIGACDTVEAAGPRARTAAASKDFADWLTTLRGEARAEGVSARTVEAALTGITPIPKVLELDRKQPESTLSFQQYMERVVNPGRIDKGRHELARHRAVLEAVATRYGVQPRFVVALWAVETDFGRITGGFPVVQALATLAYDGRRSAFFRGELMHALKIIDEGHITAEKMIGSWAGAMGQCQFMPSSFRRHAQDWNGDGRRDIWGTVDDVFASAANYLGTSGWKGDEGWGRAVRLPDDLDPGLIGLETRKPVAVWAALGVTGADGKKLPDTGLSGSVIRAEGGKGPAFLVFENYRTILKWNRSTYFALAVGHLADALVSR
ncbi:MAG: lytic murein transglycosylase [Alphaproteobacteria bacterium]|nr:lytic murein transglycosylase [Alphaproteobacteria bacterium]